MENGNEFARNSQNFQRLAIDLLRPSPLTCRRHPRKQIEKLQRSLEAFGQVMPVSWLILPDGEIVDHELVWRALKANGASHVDVIIVADETPQEIKALRLMLNRCSARWTLHGITQICASYSRNSSNSISMSA